MRLDCAHELGRAQLLFLILIVSACGKSEAPEERREASGERSTERSQAKSSSPPALQINASEVAPSESEVAPSEPASPLCPLDLQHIPGGRFAVGSKTRTFEGEENPRFWTKVAPFCAAPTEVTALEYDECVKVGSCSRPRGQGKRCTWGKVGKEDHPINCIDFAQASEVCAFRGLRLPSEVEWEYLARGGSEMRQYPWGDAEPDGRTCWKHHETCRVKSYAAGAFGLFDVTGNVWEWTSSWFGPYPWPSQVGRHRVYRGGSWSRRFDKWLKPTLRNRASPDDQGSHLGVRCVSALARSECPYGEERAANSSAEGAAASSPGLAACAFGIDEVECGPGLSWNGARCSAPGEPRCGAGTEEAPGRGCVRADTGRAASPAQRSAAESELDLSPVSRRRSPEFDADCQTNQPSRPHSFRYEGGEHLARNRVMAQDGCKNRDVGVGWNSGCCPGK